jgi:hypothetical protein
LAIVVARTLNAGWALSGQTGIAETGAIQKIVPVAPAQFFENWKNARSAADYQANNFKRGQVGKGRGENKGRTGIAPR